MRVIFLDIDGVLNTDEHLRATTQQLMTELGCSTFRDFHHAFWGGRIPVESLGKLFFPPCVERFNRFVVLTNAQIVLSTSWRKHRSLDEMIAILKQAGVERAPCAMTPYKLSSNKSMEISWWLRDNPLDNFVVFDDDPIHLSAHEGRVVRCDSCEGLSVQDCLKGLEILS